jgi:hypothetical protein
MSYLANVLAPGAPCNSIAMPEFEFCSSDSVSTSDICSSLEYTKVENLAGRAPRHRACDNKWRVELMREQMHVRNASNRRICLIRRLQVEGSDAEKLKFVACTQFACR